LIGFVTSCLFSRAASVGRESSFHREKLHVRIAVIGFCAVSSVVEHYLDTIKRPTLAIFSSFLFSFAIIVEPLISLIDSND
jgi:hypothetical protein